MATTSSVVNVGDTEVQLHNAVANDLVVIKPLHNQQIYIGATGVTPATGYPVRGEIQISITTAGAIFGITDGGTFPTAVLVNSGA